MKLPADIPAQAAGACFAIVQEHHHALFACLRCDRIPPLSSFSRPMFETYVRGEWLGRRTELRVKKILEGEESLELDKLIASLQSTHDFEVKFLSEFKRKYWRAMCDYAHTGGRHIERWLTDEGMESNYTRDEILEVMKGAETIASLSIVTGLARWPTTGKSFTVDGLREKLREFFRRRFARNCVPWRHSTRKVNHRTHFL